MYDFTKDSSPLYWQTRNYFYFSHQIQQPIPKLWTSIFYKSFNQSDCFWHKRQQELNRENLENLFWCCFMKIQIRGFWIGCWIKWTRHLFRNNGIRLFDRDVHVGPIPHFLGVPGPRSFHNPPQLYAEHGQIDRENCGTSTNSSNHQ